MCTKPVTNEKLLYYLNYTGLAQLMKDWCIFYKLQATYNFTSHLPCLKIKQNTISLKTHQQKMLNNMYLERNHLLFS